MSCKWWYNREKNDFTQRKKKESEERILSSLKTLIIFQLDTSELSINGSTLGFYT